MMEGPVCAQCHGERGQHYVGCEAIAHTVNDAVHYCLRRIKEDRILWNRIGPGTRTFEILCEARAKATGKTVEQVEEQFGG